MTKPIDPSDFAKLAWAMLSLCDATRRLERIVVSATTRVDVDAVTEHRLAAENTICSIFDRIAPNGQVVQSSTLDQTP